jgi:hypothetical protein
MCLMVCVEAATRTACIEVHVTNGFWYTYVRVFRQRQLLPLITEGPNIASQYRLWPWYCVSSSSRHTLGIHTAHRLRSLPKPPSTVVVLFGRPACLGRRCGGRHLQDCWDTQCGTPEQKTLSLSAICEALRHDVAEFPVTYLLFTTVISRSVHITPCMTSYSGSNGKEENRFCKRVLVSAICGE